MVAVEETMVEVEVTMVEVAADGVVDATMDAVIKGMEAVAIDVVRLLKNPRHLRKANLALEHPIKFESLVQIHV